MRRVSTPGGNGKLRPGAGQRGRVVAHGLFVLLAFGAIGAFADHAGRLAYIQGGEVWVKELPGGPAKWLTADGRSRSPRWSHSGEWLAARQEDRLWVARRSGADARVLNQGEAVNLFAWSPASDILAYTTRSGSLRVTTAGEWSERELGPPGARSMAWSPDGQWLAYAQGSCIRRIRVDGSATADLCDVGSPVIVAGSSPDGALILFWRPAGFSTSLLADGASLEAVPASGGKPHVLVREMLLHSDFLAGSPDGRALAVAEGYDRETWSNKWIAVVDLSGGRSTRLTGEETAAFSPAWSPDGERIAYVAAPELAMVSGGDGMKAGAARRRIWVMKKDGSAKRRLTNDARYRDERPIWSADGRHLLFARLDHRGRASLWLMPADGSRAEEVVSDLTPAPDWFGFYGYIRWSDSFDWFR